MDDISVDAKELFLACLKQASKVALKVDASQFGDPTPDTEWNVRDLVRHIIYELAWTSDIVAGKTIQEVGDKYDGDLIGDNFAASWQKYAKAAAASVASADLHQTAHLSYGDVSVEDYLKEAASDQLIHSWDLGTATGQTVIFNPKLAEQIYEYSKPKMPGLAASGLFASPLKTASDASTQTKLLALYGRRA